MVSAGGPEGSKDPLFDAPFVDVDEWRDEPVRHRYVHGGFEGTETRFALHFPPAERYEGRFFQPVYAVPGNEHTVSSGFMPGTDGWVDFALTSGAYFAESNQGSLERFPGDDWTISGYRASAAVAGYSRALAAEMYGAHRPYGYIFGGSGGAYRAMSCVENVPGVWDGSVPYIHGTPMSVPNMFTVQFHAMRLLRDRFPGIVDALEPGGSGDMFAGLSAEEREALAEVTRMGFPPRAWFDVERIASQYHAVWSDLIDNVRKWDPDYFEDFWTVPGYLGANPPESLARARVQRQTTVSEHRHRGGGRRPGSDAASLPQHRRQAGHAGGAPHRRAAGPELAGGDADDVERHGHRPGALRRRRGGRHRGDGVRPGSRCRGSAASRPATRCSSTTPCISPPRPITATRWTRTIPSGTSSGSANNRSIRSGPR